MSGATVNAHRRVLFVCPKLDSGGAERHWAALLPALAARGFPIRVLGIEGGGRAMSLLSDAGIPVRALGATGVKSLTVAPALLRELRAGPAAVVTWGYNAHALGAAVARLGRIPQVVNWHRQPNLPYEGSQRPAVQVAACSGAYALGVTTAQVPELQHLGFRPERIAVVPNGTAPPTEATQSRTELRSALGLPADAFIPVLTCRLRPEKRVEDFIRACGSLRESVPNTFGVVVGDGPEESSLHALADHLKAPVRFVGYQADPVKYMRAGDVSCLTSEYEALPMALVEAAMCGQPCVATDVGGNAEVVRSGDNGMLVPVGDEGALVAALQLLARDDLMRARMGQASQSLATSRFTLDAMVDGYARLLAAVSAGTSASAEAAWIAAR